MIDADAAKRLAFDVPSWACGDIVGRGGATITSIQADTGCRVNLQRDSGKCVITGDTREAMEAAKARVDAIVERARAEEETRQTLRETREGGGDGGGGRGGGGGGGGGGGYGDGPPSGPHIAFPVSTRDQPAIIGRQGATISQIQDDTGCRVKLSRDSGMCYIMGGSEEGRNKAKARVCGGGGGVVRVCVPCVCVRGGGCAVWWVGLVGAGGGASLPTLVCLSRCATQTQPARR